MPPPTTPCGCNPRLNRCCFYHKLRTIQFAGTARSPQSLMEARWERDMPAYRRLRDNGLQPPHIDGCAQLETRASSQLEIEMGHLISPSVLPQVAEGMAMSRDLDWRPQDSVDDRKRKQGLRD